MAKKAKTAYQRLNDKQRKFVDRYCDHYNASLAYIEAGYKANRGNASTLKSKQIISDAIDEQTEAIGITPKRITASIAQIAFEANIKDFAPFIMGQMSLQQLSDSGVDTKLIKSVSVTPGANGTAVKVELYNRQTSHDQLLKIKGMSIDKVKMEMTGSDLKGATEAEVLAQARAKKPEDGS